jgi:hypothetical protein
MTVTTMVEALQAFMLTYPNWAASAPLYVDYLGAEPTQYTIVPLPGDKVLEEYIDGGSSRTYPFALQANFSTADEAERIQNSGFFETLSDWFETETLAGRLPTLPSGRTAEKIEAGNLGFLYQQGESETGVYQIQCKITYIQQP